MSVITERRLTNTTAEILCYLAGAPCGWWTPISLIGSAAAREGSQPVSGVMGSLVLLRDFGYVTQGLYERWAVTEAGRQAARSALMVRGDGGS